MKLAIVPAYNEEETIGRLIRRIKKKKLEVLVVDDGSKDRTYEIAKKLGAVVLRHQTNEGKGEAIRTAFKWIRKKKDVECAAIIDADLQYLPEDVNRILRPLELGEADFVMGARKFRKLPFRHRVGNFVWRKSFNFLFCTNFLDTNCGFVGMNRKAIKVMKRVGGGYIIETIFLIEALKNKLRIKQVPVRVVYRKKSGFFRGVRMVVGVLIFIVMEGMKYRLSLED